MPKTNPEDIFSSKKEIEHSVPSSISRPRFEEVLAATKAGETHSMRLGIALLAVFVVILGIIAYTYMSRSSQDLDSMSGVTTAKESFLERLFNPGDSITKAITDTDQDGLDDDKESSFFRTDAFKADSDSDGLTDREEVNVYKTDPNKNDSDNDSINDGDEIKQRRNPLDSNQNATWPPTPQEISVK